MGGKSGSTIPPEWRPPEREITVCAKCGNELLKRNAVSIYKKRRGQSVSLLTHFCAECYCGFLNEYGING